MDDLEEWQLRPGIFHQMTVDAPEIANAYCGAHYFCTVNASESSLILDWDTKSAEERRMLTAAVIKQVFDDTSRDLADAGWLVRTEGMCGSVNTPSQGMPGKGCSHEFVASFKRPRLSQEGKIGTRDQSYSLGIRDVKLSRLLDWFQLKFRPRLRSTTSANATFSLASFMRTLTRSPTFVSGTMIT